jgi:Cys/Met metabolism PLP-dependent enzyme
MPGYSDPGFDTLALHAGAALDRATGARAVPIHFTTSFVFESADHAAALFNLERSGRVYSRISNPTNAVLDDHPLTCTSATDLDEVRRMMLALVRHEQVGGHGSPRPMTFASCNIVPPSTLQVDACIGTYRDLPSLAPRIVNIAAVRLMS